MGFLGRKKNDYVTQFDSNITPEAKQTWIKEVPQPNLLTQWNESLIQVEELFTETVLYYPEKQPETLKALRTIRTEWLKIDRELVNVEESEILYDVLNREIPALVYWFGMLKSTRGSAKKNHEDDFLDLQRKLEHLQSAVIQVKAKADAQKLTRFKDLHPSTANRLKNLAWPVVRNAPEEVATKISHLHELWANQKDQTHNLEDEYLLERIATDYLPSSIELYQPFVGSIKEPSARAAFITQLQLIEDHLEGLTSRNFDAKMRTMNAQTEFLQNRLEA